MNENRPRRAAAIKADASIKRKLSEENDENTVTVNSPIKIRRSNALTSSSRGNTLTVVPSKPKSKQNKTSSSENPIPKFETTLLGSLQVDNAGHFDYHADTFKNGVLGRIITIVGGRGDRHFGFYFEGREFVFNVFEGMVIYLSQTLAGWAEFREGTDSIIIATHIIDQDTENPSVICGGIQLRSVEAPGITGITVASPAVDHKGLTAHQRAIDDLWKLSAQGSDYDLLCEMVRDHGLVVLHFGFGDLSRTLHTMIVENEIFVEILEPNEKCSIRRWSTGGPLEPFRAGNELLKHDEFVRYFDWLAIVFPFGNLTKMFVIAYKN
jgi:hypothetical protein